MANNSSDGQLAGFVKWKLEVYPHLLEYSLEVLDRISAELSSERQETSGGGHQLGGLLFGYGDGRLVRILAAVSFPMAEGNFVLLKKFAEKYESYRELSGMKLVGWFRSDNQDHAHITPNDIEVHEQFFPAPWQVLMVLGPTGGNAIAGLGASVFVRAEAGPIELHSVLSLDDVSGVLREEAALSRQETLPNRTGDKRQSSQPLFNSLRESLLGNSTGGRWKYALCAMAAMAIGAGALSYEIAPVELRDSAQRWRSTAEGFFGNALESEAESSVDETASHFSLEAAPSSSGVTLRWDPNVPVFEHADRAVIRMTSGETVEQRQLDRAGLKEGRYEFGPLAGNATIQMTVYRESGESSDSEAIVYTSSTSHTGVTATLSSLRRGTPSGLKQPSPSRGSRGRRTVDTQVTTSAPDPRRRSPSSRETRRLTTLRDLPAQPVAAAPVLIQKGAAALDITAATFSPSESRVTANRPLRTDSEEAHSQSGRLVWTGLVPEGQTLVIVDGKPSAGYLSGSLPGIPVSVSLSPGELSPAGLVVFHDQDLAPQEAVVEEVTPENTVTHITYKRAPGLAHTVSLVDVPSERNQWMRLAIRAEHQPLSVLVIRWRTMD